MDNPFADMQTEREQREQREEQARQEGQRKLEAERIAAEQRKVISLEFDQMVIPVLEQLRDAAYPQYQVVGCYAEVPRNLLKLEGSWSIGKEETVHRGWGRGLGRGSLVREGAY